MARELPDIAIFAFTALLAVAAPPMGSAAGVERNAPIPDLTGSWARATFGLEQPESGPGPLTGLVRGRNSGADVNNPILTPAAKAAVKRQNDTLASGVDFPTPSSQCMPMVAPYIYRVQEIQLLQQKNEVVFLYMQDHQVRRVRLNQPHPARPAPSWYGDSVGHYEGDTLVVDTIGAKLGRYPLVDMFGSPFSEALHVVERYRLIDYETAKATQERYVRAGVLVAVEQAAVIDEDYKGKGLQVTFTVEDKNVFTTPWSGAATYRRAAGWVENVCAENTHEYYRSSTTAVPQAEKPDF